MSRNARPLTSDPAGGARSTGGTLFDNSLIVWGSNLRDVQSHHQHPLPFLLAGGGVEGGWVLTFDEQRHNRFLVSICQLMGLDDISAHGNLDDGSGPLPGLA